MKKKEMTDEEMRAMLQEFANSQSVAIGGNIKVDVQLGSIGFTPQDGHVGFKYEDSQYLREILRGAQSFLFWMLRNKKAVR